MFLTTCVGKTEFLFVQKMINGKEPMALLNCENLHKDYSGQKALNGITLQLETGEFIALEGVSGSGKSTLLSLIGLLDRPTIGEVYIENKPTSNLSFSQRCRLRNLHFGFVFQQFHLLGDLSVLENVLLPLRYGSIPKKHWNSLAMKHLAQVDMDNRADSMPNQLSGGEQQRVAIARALVGNPTLLLADEPTGNLDSNNGKQIMTLFQQLNKTGMTILMATHNEGFAACTSRRLRLLDGQMVNPD